MATPTASEKIYAHSPEASQKVAGFRRQLWSAKAPCGRLFSSMQHCYILNCLRQLDWLVTVLTTLLVFAACALSGALTIKASLLISAGVS